MASPTKIPKMQRQHDGLRQQLELLAYSSTDPHVPRQMLAKRIMDVASIVASTLNTADRKLNAEKQKNIHLTKQLQATEHWITQDDILMADATTPTPSNTITSSPKDTGTKGDDYPLQQEHIQTSDEEDNTAAKPEN
ncbi:hypothetical protein JOB18_028773 [Solea senegalensis]|uniref:Uncharacterized protein n=1 Tax=Solea senegalensis TaxID=28829 RepID=A0AAV6PBV2_SOLSE|nr:hypothetical protein JOB18_028773 [Solea senegalensis]